MRHFTALVLVSILLTACSTYKVVTFTNEGSRFDSYYNYEIEHLKTKVDQADREKPAVIIRLEDAMHQQMTERNYQRAGKRPDLTLRYEIISNQRTEFDLNTRAFRPSIYNPYGYYYDVNERNFTESILLLELKDVRTNKIVWQGSLDLRYSRKSKKTADLIQDAVLKIFDSYRYTAGSDVPLALESEG
ncbi:MAG: DUF4136 domain-containing protein [Cyclobacteriaceae bacterium]